MKNIIFPLGVIAIIGLVIVGITYSINAFAPTPEEELAQTHVDEAYAVAEHQRTIERQEQNRKTMILKEEIEKQCKKINEEIVDSNSISPAEYIGLKLIGF